MKMDRTVKCLRMSWKISIERYLQVHILISLMIILQDISSHSNS
jgi:hypothetical protein